MVTLAGVCGASLISVFQPRVFRSEASIEVEGLNDNFLNAHEIYPNASPSSDLAGSYLQTQAEELQQSALMNQVVTTLHLERQPGFQKECGLLNKLLGWDLTQEPTLNVTSDILKRTVHVVPSRTSHMIQVIAEARDSHLAAEIANTLATAFISHSVDIRQRAAQQTYESLELQLDKLRQKLFKSEARLAEFGISQGAALSVVDQRKATIDPISMAERSAVQREVDADRRFYEAIAQRANDAALAAAVRQSNFRLVSEAQPTTRPYKPNLPLNLGIGLVGSVILGVSAATLREHISPCIGLPGEAGRCLTVPELGAIPDAPSRHEPDRVLPFPRIDRGTIERNPQLSEPFRAALASILSVNRKGADAHAFVVTSSQRMEGKTTVVGNLGIGLAEIGAKVLLIDGDMRHPQLHELFGQSNSWGLSELLRENNAIEELPLESLVKNTGVPRLSLLPSGVATGNIFALLCSIRFERLLPKVRREFDYVLVDAPCLEYADARIIGHYADQLLLVVRANYTTRRTAQAAVNTLFVDGIPPLGVILNRCDSYPAACAPFQLR